MHPQDFNPRSPHGERQTSSIASVTLLGFQSTLSSRRATTAKVFAFAFKNLFQSTLSSRRATFLLLPLARWAAYFNPRSPHGERRQVGRDSLIASQISIHALLTESDRANAHVPHVCNDFNPRSPHGERPSFFLLHHIDGCLFQSTLSSRRATPSGTGHGQNILISIHALLTESDSCSCGKMQAEKISIHALLTESDYSGTTGRPTCADFNPRSPHGERPQRIGNHVHADPISIHALLTESDPAVHPKLLRWRYFNPRSPHGERPA